MLFGLTIEKIILITVIVGLIIGPERLPALATQLATLIRRAKEVGQTAKGRMQEQMGDEFTEVDWQRLDPRLYDPRRIIRDALIEPVMTPGGKTPSEAALLAARRSTFDANPGPPAHEPAALNAGEIAGTRHPITAEPQKSTH